MSITVAQRNWVEKLLAKEEARDPRVVELARFVSPAVFVEPELLRAMRVKTFPSFDAGVEADLWFGKLTRARGVDGIRLDKIVVEELRNQLAEYWNNGTPSMRRRIGGAQDVMERVHRNLTPALALEERVNWLAVKGDQEGIENELGRVVVTIAEPGRPGLLRWWTNACGRLPDIVRETRASWILRQVASAKAGPRQLTAVKTPNGLHGMDLAKVLSGLPDVKLGVRRASTILELGEVEGEGAAAILVPDTDPRLVDILYGEHSTEKREALVVPLGEVVQLSVGLGPIELRTARGVVYRLAELAQGEHQRPTAGYRVLVISTFEDLKDHRAHVIRQLRQAGFHVDPMEDWTADRKEPKQFSRERLEGCDLCVLLVAFRRGYVPKGETRSITQLEYEAAVQKGVDIVPFLLQEDAPWPRKFDETDKDPELRAWREKLLQRHLVEFFTFEPRSIVLAGVLTRWLGKHKTDQPELGMSEGINWPEEKSPYPGLGFFDEEYAPLFFGRDREVNDLIEQMRHPQGRFLLISGASGSGKSSLVAAGLWKAILKEGRLPGSTKSSAAGYRVLVISTFEDLKDHRAHVIRQLRQAGFHVDPMEDWTADPKEPKQFSRERLEGCDLCVLLVAFRRGYVPKGETRSITQLEFEAAVNLEMDVLVFMLDDDAFGRAKFDDREKDPELTTWRGTLRKRHGVDFFTHDPSSIDIGGALARWLTKRGGRAEPKWVWLRITPVNGKGPFDSLAWGLKKCFPRISHKPVELADELAENPSALKKFLASYLNSDQELLLFVDQLEELFTLGFKDDEIQNLLEQLVATTQDPQNGLRVVAVVRSEIIAKLEESRPVLQVLNEGYHYLLGPMSPRIFQEIIEKPAEALGYHFEPHVVDEILAEAGREPGSLALVAYTLKQLFERRRGRTFTLAAYREMGGMLGSIGAKADQVLNALGEVASASFNRVFEKLVHLEQDRTPTRKRVPLVVFQQDSGAMQLIQKLAASDCSILVLAEYGQGPTVEVAHEKIFTAWPRLRLCLQENRQISSDLEPATETEKSSGREEWAKRTKESDAAFAYDIYLSHSSHDSEKAMTIVAGFRACGWSVFQNLEKGPEASSVYEVMNEALSNSRIIVVGWSNHSIHSLYVKIEAERGLERNMLFPILIDDVIVPSEFADIQAADLIGWQGDQEDAKWKQVVQDLGKILGPSLIKTKAKKQGIFISYRRDDSLTHAGRLYDRLADKFGEKRIIMDIDTMKPGLDFSEQIEKAVQSCDVVIAVIGKTWVNITDKEGHRRLDNPKDFVRVEIQAALERNIPVIPLLFGGAGMPKAADLPESLAKLRRRQAMEMSDDDERFRADTTRLIEQIQEYVTEESVEGSPKSEVPE